MAASLGLRVGFRGGSAAPESCAGDGKTQSAAAFFRRGQAVWPTLEPYISPLAPPPRSRALRREELRDDIAAQEGMLLK
jgi:hypothetical protein